MTQRETIKPPICIHFTADGRPVSIVYRVGAHGEVVLPGKEEAQFRCECENGGQPHSPHAV